jgi:hypothetical protein
VAKQFVQAFAATAQVEMEQFVQALVAMAQVEPVEIAAGLTPAIYQTNLREFYSSPSFRLPLSAIVCS